MEEKKSNEGAGRKSIFARWFEKLDKKMEEKAKSKGCCCGPKDDKGSCCS